MDYKAFYAEIASWIMQCNHMAASHGFDSNEFWKWVMESAVSICTKYENNDLVTKQMVMLYLWLEDMYAKTVIGKGA